MPWYPLFPAAELEPGTCRATDAGGEEIVVVNVDSELYALSNICSHDHAELSEGELEGAEIVCPLHAARFDVRSGEALTPPAYEPVATFPLRVEDGLIMVEVED